jgi:hypothetical protein
MISVPSLICVPFWLAYRMRREKCQVIGNRKLDPARAVADILMLGTDHGRFFPGDRPGIRRGCQQLLCDGSAPVYN